MTYLAEPVLSPAQKTEYWDKGFLVLRGLFSPEEIAAWKDEAARLLASDYVDPNNLRTRPRKINGELVVERFDPVVDISPLFSALSRDNRIVDAISTLYDDAMLLFKDKLIFKLPGMSGYSLHQDWAWWQPFPRDIVSVTVAIDGADKENGALEVFPGRHREFLSPPGALRNMTAEEAQGVQAGPSELIETVPGDVVLFDCLTPHQSGPNTSNRSRQQLYLSYCGARHGNLYETQARHYHDYNLRKMSDEEKSQLFMR